MGGAQNPFSSGSGVGRGRVTGGAHMLWAKTMALEMRMPLAWGSEEESKLNGQYGFVTMRFVRLLCFVRNPISEVVAVRGRCLQSWTIRTAPKRNATSANQCQRKFKQLNTRFSSSWKEFGSLKL